MAQTTTAAFFKTPGLLFELQRTWGARRSVPSWPQPHQEKVTQVLLLHCRYIDEELRKIAQTRENRSVQ